MRLFKDNYLKDFHETPLNIIEIGSQIVSDSDDSIFRNIFRNDIWEYTGLDIENGFNVDLVVKKSYDWIEIDSNSYDLVVSGQTFEHIEFFWITMFEIGRILKPGGVAVVIAPSGGFEHRYPVDCWRFYRDGFYALAKALDFNLLESFTDFQRTGDAIWGDSIGIFQKPNWGVEQVLDYEVRVDHIKRSLPTNADFVSLEITKSTLDFSSSVLKKLTCQNLTEKLEIIRLRENLITESLSVLIKNIFKKLIGVNLGNYLKERKILGSSTPANSWGTNSSILQRKSKL